jgi:outer membrane protein TolC
MKNNRSFLVEIENLFVKEIDLAVAQHNYWPVLQPLTYAATYGPDSTLAHTASVGVSQKLPFGGSLTVGGSTTATRIGDAAAAVGTIPSATLTVPLARGSGRLITMEPWVAAARSYTYGKRQFEDFKQSFAVGIVNRYFSILQHEKTIVNFEQSLKNARRLLDESQAKYGLARVTKTDVFRAELQHTQAENALLAARESLKIERDQFKLELGLDPGVDIELRDEEIAFRAEEIDEKAYVESVLANNLVWKNTQEQFEDSKRALAIAADAPRMQADLSASWSKTYTSDPAFRNLGPGSDNWLVGLTLSVPLDRLTLNGDYQRAVTRFVQQERQFQLSRDTLVRQARERLIALRQASFTIRLQKAAVDQADKGLRLVTIEYREGKKPNRDVIEAQNNLIQAQNAHLQVLVNYKIALLSLRQFTGQLAIDEGGKWLD